MSPTNSLGIGLALAAILFAPVVASGAPGGETVKLFVSPAEDFDQLGESVAIDGDVALAGSPNEDALGPNSGAAYLFDPATGAQLHRLLPVDGQPQDGFGLSVALDAGLALVGALYDNPSGLNSGSTYVFDVATGTQLFKLVPGDGGIWEVFGAAVALQDGLALIGAWRDNDNGIESGSAYLFDATTGQELAELHPLDATAHQFFGCAVALDGTTALVGARGDDTYALESGAAYLFDTRTRQQIAKLLPPHGGLFDRFGSSVAMHGALALVGAPGEDSNGWKSGAAYLFDATTGQLLAKLLPDDPAAEDEFGTSVAIEGDRLLVGATWDDDNGSNSGSAYLFDAATGVQIAKLLASDGESGAFFGNAADLDGDSALVGAFGDNGAAVNSGAAYVFDVSQAIAVPYCSGDGSGGLCPCGNAGDRLHGCANSAYPSGSRLSSAGSPCVGADDLVLHATRSRPLQAGVFFQGDNATNGGLGFPFGDGLRCAGGNELRLEIALADATGAALSTVPIAAAGGVSAGEVRRYQWWYRDPGASPCGSGFNLSNGLEVVWAP